jgi:hypothetical protein
MQSQLHEATESQTGDQSPATTDGTDYAGKAKTLKPGPHAGDSIPARGPGRDFTRGERDAVNKIGEETGCHTCGEKTPGTKSGDFVPDHQPPSKLAPGAQQRLYPHCLSCARTQGGEVNGELKRK